MTREEAIRELNTFKIGAKSELGETALDVAIKALELEQESMLDKIIDEIMDTGAYEQEVNGKTEFLKGINYCFGVIDKYKAESEDKE